MCLAGPLIMKWYTSSLEPVAPPSLLPVLPRQQAQPIIDIQRTQPSEASPSNSTVQTQTLPVRPDPDSPNSQPHYPDRFQVAGQSRAIIVLAKVLVLEDGTVGDAIVSGSCGISELDAVAIAFVKQYWRFLPALWRGKPVQDWINVEVLFKGS